MARGTLWAQSSDCFWWNSSEERSPRHLWVHTNTLETRMSQNAFPSSSLFSFLLPSVWNQLSPRCSDHLLDIPFECEASAKFCSKPFLKLPFAAAQTVRAELLICSIMCPRWKNTVLCLSAIFFHPLSSTKTKSRFVSVILITCSWTFAIWFQRLGWSFPHTPLLPLLYNLAFWNGFFPHLLLRNWRFPQLATGCSTVCAGALYSIFQVPDWCVFHMDSGLNWYKTIFQVRLAGTVQAICLTLYQDGWAASWDHLGIFLNEFIVLWSTSDISNLSLLLYCHLLGHYICVFYLTLGLKIIVGKCFMVVYVDWMFWHVQL